MALLARSSSTAARMHTGHSSVWLCFMIQNSNIHIINKFWRQTCPLLNKLLPHGCLPAAWRWMKSSSFWNIRTSPCGSLRSGVSFSLFASSSAHPKSEHCTWEGVQYLWAIDPVFVMVETISVCQTWLSLSRLFFYVCVVWLQASWAQSFCVASAVEGQGWVHQPSVQGRAEPDSGRPETQHHPLLLQVSHCSKHTWLYSATES